LKLRERQRQARRPLRLKAVAALEGIETQTLYFFAIPLVGLKAVAALEGIETSMRLFVMHNPTGLKAVAALEGIET
jgi:hypothetical protein